MTKLADVILCILNKYKIDPKRLSKSAEWKNSGKGSYALEELTYKSWTRYQLDLKSNLDVNFFLACANSWQIKLMSNAFNFWNKEGIA